MAATDRAAAGMSDDRFTEGFGAGVIDRKPWLDRAEAAEARCARLEEAAHVVLNNTPLDPSLEFIEALARLDAALSDTAESAKAFTGGGQKVGRQHAFNKGRKLGAADMRERAVQDIDNEREIAKEEASNDGDYGAGFLHGLKYAAERIRALPLTEGKADD